MIVTATHGRVLLLGTNAAGIYTGVTAGTSIPVDVRAANLIAIYLTSIGTTSGGTILIEEADWNPDTDAPYSGTWSQVASIAASSFTGGAQTAYHISPNDYGFLRVRISSAITGGGTIWIALRTQ